MVEGYHNIVTLILTGPSGELMNEAIYPPGNESELASYRCFPGTDGTTTGPGVYSLYVEVFANLLVVLRKTYYFTLYTDEFLSKSKFELWNTSKIGDISIQDDSRFKYPGWFNPRAILADLEHDKVILTHSLEGTDGWTVVHTETYDLVSPETNGEYDVYDSPQTGQLPGNYRIHGSVELSGDVVMERQNDFVILPKPATAESGVTLVEMVPNTANYTEIQDLPLAGAEVNLPVGGFNALCRSVGGEVDWVGVEYFREVSNQFILFDLTKYTKKPGYVSFTTPVLTFEVLAFDILSSLEISDIHAAPSTHRFRFTGRLGGETGSIIGIAQADVSFRVPLDPADLSGLRFLSGSTLIDSNMPKTGRVYAIPVAPDAWTVSALKTKDSEEFDTYITYLKKNGVVLDITGGYVKFGSVVPTTALTSDTEAYIFGLGSPGSRTLKNPADVDVLIDGPGGYEAKIEFYRLGVLLDSLESDFELIAAEDIPEVPEADTGECCISYSQLIGDGSSVDYYVNHMLDTKKVHVTIRDVADDTEVFVENKATTSNQILISFFEAPALNSYLVIVEK
jgi:hypothetical protein